MNAAPSSVHVGIDVSKASLDIAVRPTGETWQVRHSATGIAELALRLSELRPALVVLEATGGYERATLATLHDYHIPVALLNPRQVREFARAAGRLAKTDRFDAQVLALFAERMQPQPQSAPDPEQGIMEELTVRRRQLVEALTAERNRLNQMTGPGWRSVVEHIEWLEGELARIEAQLKQAISDNPAYQARADLLQKRPRRRARPEHDPAGSPPGAGTLGRQGDRRSRGGGADEQGQRSLSGKEASLGRARRHQEGALHGCRGGRAPQPCHPRLLSAALRGW